MMFTTQIAEAMKLLTDVLKELRLIRELLVKERDGR